MVQQSREYELVEPHSRCKRTSAESEPSGSLGPDDNDPDPAV